LHYTNVLIILNCILIILIFSVVRLDFIKTCFDHGPVDGVAWQKWVDVKGKVKLAAGVKVIELYEDTGGYNLEYMELTAS